MKNLLLIASIFTYSVAHAQNPHWLPANGLVGWYPFDNSATDLSPSGNNGTGHNVTPATDHLGNANKAYSFNGTSSYIEVPDSKSLRPQQITLSIWIKANSISGGVDAIIEKGNKSDANNETYGLNTNDFGIKQNSACMSGAGWQLTTHTTPLNQWLFMAATYDGDTMRTYINDLLVVKRGVKGTIDTCIGGTVRFGYNWDSYPEHFNGTMDDAAIYGRALDRCELRRLYRQNHTGIATQPQNVTGISNGSVQFSIATPGTGLIYQWQQNTGSGFANISNGSIFSGVDNDTLLVKSISGAMNNSSYRCIVTAPGLCPDTSKTAMLNVFPASIREREVGSPVSVYPNPATSKIIIKTEVSAGSNYYIMDKVGRKIAAGKTTGTETPISVANLATGVYFFRIDGVAGVCKFIKQ